MTSRLLAAGLLDREKLLKEHIIWERIESTEREDALLPLNSDGTSCPAENTDDTGSCFRVVAEEIEHFCQFVLKNVCNKFVSVLSCSVEHVQQLSPTHRSNV